MNLRKIIFLFSMIGIVTNSIVEIILIVSYMRGLVDVKECMSAFINVVSYDVVLFVLMLAFASHKPKSGEQSEVDKK